MKHYKDFSQNYISETIAEVNEDDKIIGKGQRRDAHKKGFLHREVGVWLFNKKEELLVQKRVDTNKYDHAAGGHFPHNESYLRGAIRELKEELGIKAYPRQLLKIKKILIDAYHKDMWKNKRFLMIYKLKGYYTLEQLQPNKEEISELTFYAPEKLVSMINKTPENFTNGLKTFILDLYKQDNLLDKK